MVAGAVVSSSEGKDYGSKLTGKVALVCVVGGATGLLLGADIGECFAAVVAAALYA